MTRRGMMMMGLELVVPVEHFDDGGWSNSVEYHTRYPAEVVAARMVDGLKLLRYGKESTFKTEEFAGAAGECGVRSTFPFLLGAPGQTAP